jgi:hypothetical protein
MPIPIPECLKTSICPDCGYSLLGLPARSKCPECGRSYNDLEVIIHGDSKSGSCLIRSVATVAIIVALFVIQPSHSQRQLWYGLIFVVLALLLGRRFFYRWFSHRPARFQIRLSHRGCAQYSNFVEPDTPSAWFLANAWLIPVLVIGIVGLAFARDWIDKDIFLCCFIVFFTEGLLLRRQSTYFRRALRWLREGYAPDLYLLLVQPTPWYEVSGIRLEPYMPGGRHYFQIERRRWKILIEYPVDVFFRCTDEQASALKSLIDQWREHSRPPNSDKARPAPSP